MADGNSTSGGLGVPGILAVIFICAKVFGWEPVASWSWWWVTSPLWITLLVVLVILAGVAIYQVKRG